MNDELQQKILYNLVAMYQSRGLSMEKLFSNPIFVNLPVEQKISMVKKFGEMNLPQRGMKWDKQDAQRLLLGVGLGALAYYVGKGVANKWAMNATVPVGEKLTHLAPSILGVFGAAGMAAKEFEGFNKNFNTKKTLYKMDTNDDNAIINYLARTKNAST